MAAESLSLPARLVRDEPPRGAATEAPPVAPLRRFGVGATVLIAGAFLVLLASFWKPIGWLWHTWMDRPEYSHGPIMPLIAAFLVWQRSDELARLEFPGDWRGVALAVVAAALHALGVIGAVYTVQQYALVVAAAGLAWSLTGARAFVRLLPPVAILALMIPQPDFILNNLSARLQLLSSALGVEFIRATGISVFLEGNVIDLGGYRLQVVEACDGMRYLFPLMTIGLLIAYFYRGALWKRIAVFVLSIPITVLMNSLRVGVIGVMVEYWGPGMAEGFLHEFQGWMVFMLSTGLLLGFTAAVNRIGHERGSWQALFGLELPARAPAGVVRLPRTLPLPFLVALLVVTVAGLAGSQLTAPVERPPARSLFESFPLRLGEWSGRRDTIGADYLAVLQLDDYLLADYVDPGGHRTNLYVSFYNAQRDRRVVHSPRACIPGGGWQVEESSQLALADTGLRANRMLIVKGDARALVYYWFDQRGRNLTSEYAVKWFLFWDALTRRRSDGGMVRVLTPVAPTESLVDADRRLQQFATAAVTELGPYLPR